jgi:hypothetical protein
MKKYILLMLFCLLSKSALTQEVKDYFPLEVGNKWIYRTWGQNGGYSDNYTNDFEVISKEIINDTTYYIVNCRLIQGYDNKMYLRKNTDGNIFIRINNIDKLFLKFDSSVGESWGLSNFAYFTMLGLDTVGFSPIFGKTEKTIKFINSFSKKSELKFTEGYGCLVGNYGDIDLFLKRAINNKKIVTPQVTNIISINYNADYQKILIKTFAVMSNTDT